MKQILFTLLVVGSLGALHAKTKYICTRGIMDDAVFTSEYETLEECKKYCTGIGTVCEETSEETEIETDYVD